MILLTHERQWRGGETVVAFGMFDGVHEGHAQLMRKANELAALVTRIIVAGQAERMTTIEIQQADGDRSLMTLQPS